MAATHVLAIDQGTTSTRAMIFRTDMTVAASSAQEFRQYYPQPGHVEHDADEIWRSVLETCRAALEKAHLTAGDIAAIGITNQRETTVVWDRATGEPIHKAIVWQDRRTAGMCERLRAAGHEKTVSARTGLLLDPYFSGTKLRWILDNVPGARARASKAELAFGTIDSWIIWKLTGGRVHATDATNASRTMLFDIRRGAWDPDLLKLLRVPRKVLPDVRDCAADYGQTETHLFGAAIPIRGVAGDQQAAAVGQACFAPGMIKSTYGTGCFALLNTGERPVRSRNRLLTTIACQLDGRRTYALEGSIFVAGAAVQWLRDGIGIIETASETGAMAAAADPAQKVVLVPAFTGLGAPWWDAECQGAIYGLTRGTTRNEIARAALESVCYQTRDLMDAMQRDWQGADARAENLVLRVDGGMVASDWTMQRLADMLDAPVDRPECLETTALGAAWLAGYAVGLYPQPDEFAARWRRERRFTPSSSASQREADLAHWRDCVGRTLTRPVRGGRAMQPRNAGKPKAPTARKRP